MIKNILIANKNELKYKDYDIRGDKVTVLGIGKKSIKYSIDDEEPKFAFYDSFEGRIISEALVKSFDNEVWNDEVRACIEAQAKYCKDHHDPHFAPEDGFCWSCGNQIYASANGSRGESLEYASNELITGCPHCHRSYCD